MLRPENPLRTKVCASPVFFEIDANGQHVQIERKGTHRG